MNANGYKAAVCDVDSTILLGSHLSPENSDRVQRLKKRGIRVILATGRNHHHVHRYYQELELTDALVSSDGALVSLPGTEEILAERLLPREVTAYVLEQAAARGISCLCFFREGIHVTSKCDWNVNMERHAEIEGRFQYVTVADMQRHSIYKPLLYSDTPRRLDDLQAAILERYGPVIHVLRNGPNSLEIVAAGVSKVTALDIVAVHYGFEPGEAIAFGDGPNDIGMFGWAGGSVCMFHGHPNAREKAKVVAPQTPPETNFAAAVDLVFG